LFQKCDSLFAYLDVRNEVHTRPLIDYCFKIHKPVFVPVVQKNEMFFSEIRDYSELIASVFDIPSPQNPVPTEPGSGSLFIVPGLGFDKCGNRVGYGAGFYDKYLCCRSRLHLIGVCFESQLEEKLPADETDIRMDSVLTEKRWILTKKT
jgi:5,10-methenyltetrahydrofolate synthetase